MSYFSWSCLSQRIAQAKELPLGPQRQALCEKARAPLKPFDFLTTFLATLTGNRPVLRARAGQGTCLGRGERVAGACTALGGQPSDLPTLQAP